MNKIQLHILLFSILLLLAGSCKQRYSKPKGLLSEEKLIEMLVDVHIAEAVLLNEASYSGNEDSLSPFVYARLFRKHEVSRETFESSLDYYMHYPEKMNEIYEQVFNRINLLQGEAQALTSERRDDTLKQERKQVPEQEEEKEQVAEQE